MALIFNGHGHPAMRRDSSYEIAIIIQMVIDYMMKCVHNRRLILEGFPSGQRDQTVNLTAQPSKVRILPPPPKVM